jgi:hypothetical protein
LTSFITLKDSTDPVPIYPYTIGVKVKVPVAVPPVLTPKSYNLFVLLYTSFGVDRSYAMSKSSEITDFTFLYTFLTVHTPLEFFLGASPSQISPLNTLLIL